MPNAILSRTALAARRLRLLVTQTASPRASGHYDRLIDAANRLPRPVLVYGTVALMFLALIRPDLFDRGMASLDRMPDELWWLVGAILAGHFGAREAHHLRHRAPPAAHPATPEKPGPDSPA